MLKALFETGHPWITFKDPSNIRYSNQHVGTVHSSNLCTEILLHTKPTKYKEGNLREVEEYGETAVCNLASINLKNHLKKRTLDFDKIRATAEIGMRMLDNVVDINFYPTKESENANVRHRPVGLGSMGWHDVFYALDVDYSSDEAVEWSDKIYEHISYGAILASSKLAKERGKYSTYKDSLWDQGILPIDTYKNLFKTRGQRVKPTSTLDWDIVRKHISEHGMRNSNTMAIAPTAPRNVALEKRMPQKASQSVHNIALFFNLESTAVHIYVACIDPPRKPSGPLQTPGKPLLYRKYCPRAFQRRTGRLLTPTLTL